MADPLSIATGCTSLLKLCGTILNKTRTTWREYKEAEEKNREYRCRDGRFGLWKSYWRFFRTSFHLRRPTTPPQGWRMMAEGVGTQLSGQLLGIRKYRSS